MLRRSVEQGLDPRLRVGEHEGAGRVDDVDALGTGVDHDPRLRGSFSGSIRG